MIVRGRYGHVSFIADPAPVRVTVVEVVPPRPAKLVDQLTRVLDLAEDLPPVELVPDLVDLAELAGSRPSGHYLFPCRAGGSGAESLGAGGPDAESLGAGGPGAESLAAGEQGAEGPGAGVSYLDEVPRRRPWTLVGCARSRAIHDFFYGDEVDVVDMCPRSLASRRPASPAWSRADQVLPARGPGQRRGRLRGRALGRHLRPGEAGPGTGPAGGPPGPAMNSASPGGHSASRGTPPDPRRGFPGDTPGPPTARNPPIASRTAIWRASGTTKRTGRDGRQ